MLRALYDTLTATPGALAGTVALTTMALGVFAALATVLYEDFQPKGRHHRL
ncbi:hypothetical protein GCM10022221_53390 [Actinocorallia aurea]